MANKVRLILAKPWMGKWTGDSVDVTRVEADLLIENGTAYEGPGTRAAGADARVEADGVPPKGEPMVDPGEGTGVSLSTEPETKEEEVKTETEENKNQTEVETEHKAISGPPENKALSAPVTTSENRRTPRTR